MKIYIAGKMSGIKDFNAPAFNAAAERLRARGHEVISPPELDEEHGIDMNSENGVVDPALRRELLGRDFKLISKCDAIYMLKGWYKSSGANLEHLFALDTQMTIIYEDD